MKDEEVIPVVKFDMGSSGKVFVRFRVADFVTFNVRTLRGLLKKFNFQPELNDWTGPAWRLSSLINKVREMGLNIYLGPTVAHEMARMASRHSSPDAVARADSRIDAIEAATGRKYREYQREDIRWMEAVGSCIIANEMRTGKTPTLLAMIPPAGAIVVCPLTVRSVWKDHVRQWLPWATAVVKAKSSPDANEVVICNYERIPKPSDVPQGVLLIADEGHYLKNHNTGRTKAFIELADAVKKAGGRVIIATGTPAKNGKASELWPLLELVGAGKRLFRDSRNFAKEFKEYYREDEQVTGPLSMVMTKRSLESVVKDLPPYTWEVLSIYWDELEFDVFDFGDQQDLEALQDDLDSVWAKYSMYDDPVAEMRRNPSDIGEYSRMSRMLSILKIPSAIQWAKDMAENGIPAIAVSAHREPVIALGKLEGWGHIVGGMPEYERNVTIKAFQAGELLGVAFTIGVGSMGLDFSRADNLLSIDQSWVPGDNDQAYARMISVSDPRPKFGTRLVLDHPLERRVDEVLNRKEEVIGATVGKVSTNSKAGQNLYNVNVNKYDTDPGLDLLYKNLADYLD